MKIKWGILGTGKINDEFIPAVKTARNSELIAIASRNIERAKDFSIKYDIPRYYGNYDSLLDDPEIQAVYIPLPNHLHFEWIIKSLDKKKNVLCEKPAVLDTKQMIKIIEKLEKSDLLFMEAFMYRFMNVYREIKRIVDTNCLGMVRNVDFVFAFNAGKVLKNNYRWKKDQGGGSFYDLGCYGVDFVHWLFNREARVLYSQLIDSEGGIDIQTKVTLNIDDILITITSGFNFHGNYIFIGFEKGYLIVPKGINRGKEKNEILIFENEKEKSISFEPETPYTKEIEHFADCIINNTIPYVSIEDSLRNIRVLEKIISN